MVGRRGRANVFSDYNECLMRMLGVLLVLFYSSVLFAAYPDEYPGYLRLLGFSKDEIRDLQDGSVLIHSLKKLKPGESGITAAKVFDVPAYFIRDYFSYIENFRSLQDFQAVGKFAAEPLLQDLAPLTFDQDELGEFGACKESCRLNLTDEEKAGIQKSPDQSLFYRTILLNRLHEYRKRGDHTGSYLEDFDHLSAYFPEVLTYLSRYPESRNPRTLDFFYWGKERIGKTRTIQIRHVFAQKIGDDFVVVNHLVYSNHSIKASAAVLHLINYVDSGFPRTLLVYRGKNSIDPEIGSTYRQDKRIFSAFRTAGEELENRYLSSAYPGFPYGLKPTDQR